MFARKTPQQSPKSTVWPSAHPRSILWQPAQPNEEPPPPDQPPQDPRGDDQSSWQQDRSLGWQWSCTDRSCSRPTSGCCWISPTFCSSQIPEVCTYSLFGLGRLITVCLKKLELKLLKCLLWTLNTIATHSRMRLFHRDKLTVRLAVFSPLSLVMIDWDGSKVSDFLLVGTILLSGDHSCMRLFHRNKQSVKFGWPVFLHSHWSWLRRLQAFWFLIGWYNALSGDFRS